VVPFLVWAISAAVRPKALLVAENEKPSEPCTELTPFSRKRYNLASCIGSAMRTMDSKRDVLLAAQILVQRCILLPRH
jgi:hypothetical protein